VSILRGQAGVLQTIHSVLSDTYLLEQTLSGAMDVMIDELDGAEV
jgi:hypothetical protein